MGPCMCGDTACPSCGPMQGASPFAPSVQHTKVCIGPKDRYYQVILERCIEMGYFETDEAEVYKDGDLYIVDWLMSAELQRADSLYGGHLMPELKGFTN